MSAPLPITDPQWTQRAPCVYDLELTLVKFLTQLFDHARLDNPTLNFAQATRPEHPIMPPDQPTVSYDPVERAQTLVLKVAPRVVRGRIPRTVTGEVALDRLPDCPAIIIQTVSARVQNDETIVTVKILFTVYDENPDSQGYQDMINLIEAAAIALTSFGQAALDATYPIVMPLEWRPLEPDCFPHFIGEMVTQWELPSGRPLPDAETFGIVPAEHLEFQAS